ncbi:MAG: ABC transporter permease [Polyangiaceae bacterium]|nr:ABC transporter permease [Polyangiaceae bacterium]
MIPVRYNLRSLVVRKATTAATSLGIALVVFVLAASMMLVSGIDRTLGAAGRADNAIVLRRGSDAELNSIIDVQKVGLVAAAPGVATAGGGPAVAGEIVVVATMNKVGGEGFTNVLIRGVTERSASLRGALTVVEGRAPSPGADEVMIGKQIRGRFPGVDLGQSFELKKNRAVKVVGVFTDGGSSHESEVWGDVELIRSSFGRAGVVSGVRVRLTSPAAFDAFKQSVEGDKNLGFEALRETAFLEKQSEGLRAFVTALGASIAFFFSVGAMIGAMITMYASIANRRREIGTLRALGFPRWQILLSFLIESITLALAGGALGAGAATALKLVSFSMMNFSTWSEMVFTFQPTPGILGGAMAFAGVMGLVGGFFPALAAARTSPVVAMKG